MFLKIFSILGKVLDLLTYRRPVFVEKHDFSAALYKDKKTTTPSFSVATAGENTFDIYKIVAGVAAFTIWFGTMKLYFTIRRRRRKKKKAMKKAAKAK